jgi:peptidoglycan/xylan/chitin deacetylase (PgdA/CDA1 family)
VSRLVRVTVFLSVVLSSLAVAMPALHAEAAWMLVDGHMVAITSGTFTVADALAAAGEELKPGPVYSAGTHTLLGNDGPLPDLTLNDQPARPDRLVYLGDELKVVPVLDTVESTVTRQAEAQIGGLPDVEHVLFHPGRAPIVEQTVGERSGEVVSEVTKPAVPAEPVTDKLVALTFDDGPDPTWTPQILDILKSEGVVATFCLVGSMLNRQRALGREEVASGHMVCNHTANHGLLGKAARDRVESEIDGGADAVKAVTGVDAAFYRPPGGELSPTVVDVAHERGQRVLHWSLDTIDYRRPPAAVLVERVMRNVGPGAVILMHDGGGDRSQTVAALRPIIEALKADGYGFTTPASPAPVG